MLHMPGHLLDIFCLQVSSISIWPLLWFHLLYLVSISNIIEYSCPNSLKFVPTSYCRMLVPNGGNLLPGPGGRQCHPALRVDQWHPWRPAITSCLGLPSRGRQWLFLKANLPQSKCRKLTSKGCLEESKMKWLWFSTLRYLFWISLVESSNLPGYMCWGVENNKPCVRRFDHQLL